MFSAAHIANSGPANTQFHMRLQLRVTRFHVPYVRPVVVLTSRSGARM